MNTTIRDEVEKRYAKQPQSVRKSITDVLERMNWCPEKECASCTYNFMVLDSLLQTYRVHGI